MRIKDGCFYLSKTDTKRWNTSEAFRHEVTELMSDHVHKNLSRQGHGSVIVYDYNGQYIASIWTKEKAPTTGKVRQ